MNPVRDPVRSVVRTSPGRRPVYGYTLLEVLVALAVSGMLLGLLSQTLGGLQLALRSAMASDASAEGMTAGRRMVTHLLAEALPPVAGDDAYAFQGRSDSVEFVTTPPAAFAFLGPLRMRLFVAPIGTGQMGLYAEARAAAGTSTAPAIRRTLLVGGLQWARLAYAADPSTPPMDRWSDPSGHLPALVQLRWRFTADAAEHEPLVVAPRRTLTSGCRFDPVSLTCRGGT